MSPDKRVALCQRDAKPAFDDFEVWLAVQLNRILGKSELAKAIRNALGRMKKMRGCLENGSLELDNNCAQRSISCVALDRKKYLFVGSEGGGKRSLRLYLDRIYQTQRRQCPSLAHLGPRPNR